jgi:hypothetical protein
MNIVIAVVQIRAHKPVVLTTIKNGQMLNLSKEKHHLSRDMVNGVAVNMVTKVICMQPLPI